jgi:methyltransferase (TIGR00027 family)
MKDGTASQTARSVAAHRLDFDRVQAPYGDPEADIALARDVAAGLVPPQTRIHDYLRGRTRFFDNVVVSAIDGGIGQVVVGAAGYDGRAFRYAKPGVRWFEVDHPDTQADKLRRLARLGVGAPHIRYVAADFTHAPVADLLVAAGLDTGAPALFLLEGIAIYLDKEVLERVLGAFRSVAADASMLAISVSLARPETAARDRFRAAVAAAGEPARTELAPDEARRLLAARGWQLVEARDRSLAAGLLLACATQPSFSYPERSRPTPQPPPAPQMSPAPVGSGLPLSALLSQALVAFTIELDNEAEHRVPHTTTDHGLADGAQPGAPWLTSLVMWANCLRFLPDDGITVAELHDLARTWTNLDGMRRWGYVTYTPDPGRGKRPGSDSVMRPTAKGRQARDLWRGLDDVIEERWRARFGPAAVGALRSALADIAADLDPALPDCLPILHHGLFSTQPDIAEPDIAEPDIAEPSPPAASASAAASAPTPTAPAATFATATTSAPSDALPLWALLSRVLLAFATDFERESPVSLAIAADVLRVLPADGDAVRNRDIPALAGVSKESIAMALGYLGNRGLTAEGPDPSASRGKVTRLTPSGGRARQAYDDLVAAIEERWRMRFGADRVAALRASLEPLATGDPPPLFAGLVPYPEGWRAKVSRPSVLPHYPMVLHRGGYPDGS